MKRLYDEYFHVPENGKISDKVMLVRVITTVVIMIACLAAMSFTAYAYFSSNAVSSSNIIKSANFDIVVTVNDSDTPLEIKKEDAKTYSAYLEAEKVYTVTIDNDEVNSTAKTGFCIIEAVGCSDVYHTQQIGTDATVDGGNTDKITFEISVTESTTVKFTPHWGTSSYYDAYKDNGEDNKLYITNDNIGEKKVVIYIPPTSEQGEEEQ